MINLEQTFTPRVNPADTDYPFGSIKNNTSPGANDGTPLSAVWGNDFEGFRQAAITEAGIIPSGLPDTAQDSQLLEAMKAVTSNGLRSELAGDSGASLIEFKPSPVAGAIKRGLDDVIYDQIIDVRWFGAIGNWNTETQTGADDTAAFQAAIAYYATLGTKRAGGRRAIKVPAGNYKITNLTLPASVKYLLEFFGEGKHVSTIWSDQSVSAPAIDSAVDFVVFRSLSLFGSLLESNQSANWRQCFYRGKKADNTADIDVIFIDCEVGYAVDFAQIYGRGCVFDAGTVAVYCTNLMNIVCTDDMVWSASTNNTLYTGMRHYTIRNMRADVVSRIIKVSGTGANKDWINDIQIVGCDFAACDRLIDAPDASLRGPLVANNQSIDSFAGGVVTARVVVNAIDSSNQWRNKHDEQSAPTAYQDCIEWLWKTTGAINGLTISGTTAKNVSLGVVQAGASSGNIKIVGNHFPQFATYDGGSTTHKVFDSPYNCVGLQIGGNSFSTVTISGTYQMFDAAVQTDPDTRTWANIAPWTWADMRLRYTPKLLVNRTQSATTPTAAHGRYTMDDTYVFVEFMISINPAETTGNLSISLPSVAAVAENSAITSSYSGDGFITSISGFSVTGWGCAPMRVNPATQEAELYREAGMVRSRITAADKSGLISLFGTIKYRYN